MTFFNGPSRFLSRVLSKNKFIHIVGIPWTTFGPIFLVPSCLIGFHGSQGIFEPVQNRVNYLHRSIFSICNVNLYFSKYLRLFVCDDSWYIWPSSLKTLFPEACLKQLQCLVLIPASMLKYISHFWLTSFETGLYVKL